MKTNGLRGLIYKTILLVLLSLYFLLVFGRPVNNSNRQFCKTANVFLKQAGNAVDTPLPKLLTFEGVASNKQVRLNWKFETTVGLDECILERSDTLGAFKPVAYFFMTEDIHIPDLRYTDSVPKNRIYHYRLILTGRNGDRQYTKTLTFNFGDKEDQKRSLSYPLVME